MAKLMACKPGAMGLILGFFSLSHMTMKQSPVSVCVERMLNAKATKQTTKTLWFLTKMAN